MQFPTFIYFGHIIFLFTYKQPEFDGRYHHGNEQQRRDSFPAPVQSKLFSSMFIGFSLSNYWRSLFHMSSYLDTALISSWQQVCEISTTVPTLQIKILKGQVVGRLSREVRCHINLAHLTLGPFPTRCYVISTDQNV